MSGVDPRNVVRIEIVRVTLEGTPSCVTRAVFRVIFADGREITKPAEFAYGVMYEALVAEVRNANRGLAR